MTIFISLPQNYIIIIDILQFLYLQVPCSPILIYPLFIILSENTSESHVSIFMSFFPVDFL